VISGQRLLRMLRGASLTAVALLGLSTGAAQAASAAHIAPERQAIHVLLLRGDADSIAAAAALSFKQNTSPGALELAANAAELAPQRPVISWLHLQICVATPSCDFRDVATVLRWIDADNGASWLPLLAAAYRDGDSTEVDRIIDDMAQTKRFDVYWNPLVVLLADALYKARADLPHGFAGSDAERYQIASSIAGELLPPLSSLLDSCRASGAGSERREACMKVSRIMQHGDAIATQLAGFGLEKRLVAADSKEGRALNERRRLLEWRVAAATQADAPLPWLKNAHARKQLARMRASARQEDVDVAILREHKMAAATTEKRP
jgi:hypothetical protein